MNPLVLITLFVLGAYVVNGATIKSTFDKASIKLLSIDTLRIEGAEFVLTATVAIDNPTSNSPLIQQPYLSLLYNGNPIATSKPSGEKKPLLPNDRTKFTLDLRMPFTSVPVIAVAVLNKKDTGGQVVILETYTVINGIAIRDQKDVPIANLVKLVKQI